MEIVHGGDIYSYNREMLDFSANISPLGIPEEIRKAIQNSYQYADIYPDTQYRELRSEIAEIEHVHEENIICGNGAAEIIFNIVLAMKPKKVLLICPSFAEYEKAVDNRSCFPDHLPAFHLILHRIPFCKWCQVYQWIVQKGSGWNTYMQCQGAWTRPARRGQ